MDARGFEVLAETVREEVGNIVYVCPAPNEGEDHRFVHFEISPAEQHDKSWLVSKALNRLATEGLLEQHGLQDYLAATDRPAFRVLSIEGGLVHLEDTNSANY